jgi:hypothetical protein
MSVRTLAVMDSGSAIPLHYWRRRWTCEAYPGDVELLGCTRLGISCSVAAACKCYGRELSLVTLNAGRRHFGPRRNRVMATETPLRGLD